MPENCRQLLHLAGFLLLAAGMLIGGCTGDGDRTDALIADLYAEDQAVQREAAGELVAIGAPAVEPLIGVFGSGDREPSQWAAAALCQIGNPSVRPLIDTLATDDNTTRDWAVVTLACIGEPAAGPLIEALWSGDERVSGAATVALIKIGPPAIPALRELESSPVAERRQKAAMIIRSIALSEQLQAQSGQAGNTSIPG
jgi:HEAT repeat protein